MSASRAVVALIVGTSIAVWLAACGGGSTPATPVPTAPAVAANPTGASVPGAVNPGFASTAYAQSTANAATQTTQQRVYATSVAASAEVRQTDVAISAIAATATRGALLASAAANATVTADARAQSLTATASSISAAKTATAMPTPTAVLPAVLAPVTGQPGDTSGALRWAPGQLRLLLLRDAPELADDAVLLPFITQQIQAEAAAWKNIDDFLKQQRDLQASDGYKQHPAEYQWCPHGKQDPTNPCLDVNLTPVTFAWQKLVDQQPDLAQGPLLDAFVDPDADWSFVSKDPTWDDSKYNVVGLFLFSRDSVEGRQPEFAARELLPVVRQFVKAAVQRAPTRFWFDVVLPGVKYDFATSSFRFSNVDPASGRANGFVDKINILPTHNTPYDLADLPDAVRTTANYAGIALNQPTYPPPTALHGAPRAITVTSGAASWQSVASGYWMAGSPGALALDRTLQVPAPAMDAARAEALLKKYPSLAMTARVYINVERVLTYKPSSMKPRTDLPAAMNLQSVAAARVERVDVFAGSPPQPGADPSGPAQGDFLASFK
jgi:hypothetical protein